MRSGVKVYLAERSECPWWDRFVASRPESLYSERLAWRDVLVESLALSDRLLVAEDGGEVVGVLALFLNRSRLGLGARHAISGPLSSSGGGLVAATPQAEEALLSLAGELARQEGWRYVLLRLTRPLRAGEWWLREGYVTFSLDLSQGEEHVWRRIFRDKTRNQVRKARKYGFRVEQGHHLLPRFWAVLHEGMRELGSPCPPPSIFRCAVEHFGPQVEFLVLFDGDLPVAGTVLFFHRRTVANPWAVSLRRYRPQCANTLLYHEIVKLGCRRGMERFDLGRSLRGSGTYHFKRRLGAQEQPLYYYYWARKEQDLPPAPQESAPPAWFPRLYSRLPRTLTRRLGALLIKELV